MPLATGPLIGPLVTNPQRTGETTVNVLGGIFETLFWPVLGLADQQRYDNNGAIPNRSGTMDLKNFLLLNPLTTHLATGTSDSRTNPNASVPITVIALPVVAALVVVGLLLWKGRK